MHVFCMLTRKWEFTVNVMFNQAGGCCSAVLMMDTESPFLQSTDGAVNTTRPPISTTNHSDEPSLGHCLPIERTEWEE